MEVFAFADLLYITCSYMFHKVCISYISGRYIWKKKDGTEIEKDAGSEEDCEENSEKDASRCD